jgi:hypothetical protein
MAVLLFLLPLCSIGAAQTPAPPETPRVWSLATGDTFRAAVTSTRTTSISINGKPQPPLQSTDLIQFEYQARGTFPNGDAIISVRIIAALCDVQLQDASAAGVTASARPPGSAEAIQRRLLQVPPFVLKVSPEGDCRTASPQQHLRFLEQLAANDAGTFSLLKKSCPDELYSSWFGRPFWFPTRKLLTEAAKPWSASCTESCGPFGVLQTEITLERQPPQDGFALCSLKGTPRFVPLVLPAAKPSDPPETPLPVSGITVESASFVGTARLKLPDTQPDPDGQSISDPDAERQPKVTPPFQSLETVLTVAGRGVPSESAKAGVQADEFTFNYSHNCRFTIIGYSFMENDRIEALPVPQR